jgi:hypothetical protein
MTKYVKKPVEVDAVEWKGNNLKEVHDLMGIKVDFEKDHRIRGAFQQLEASYRIEGLIINTLEGDMKANVGDFIIKGVNGEFYPCKPDIFKKTYTEV